MIAVLWSKHRSCTGDDTKDAIGKKMLKMQ